MQKRICVQRGPNLIFYSHFYRIDSFWRHIFRSIGKLLKFEIEYPFFTLNEISTWSECFRSKYWSVCSHVEGASGWSRYAKGWFWQWHLNAVSFPALRESRAGERVEAAVTEIPKHLIDTPILSCRCVYPRFFTGCTYFGAKSKACYGVQKRNHVPLHASNTSGILMQRDMRECLDPPPYTSSMGDEEIDSIDCLQWNLISHTQVARQFFAKWMRKAEKQNNSRFKWWHIDS